MKAMKGDATRNRGVVKATTVREAMRVTPWKVISYSFKGIRSSIDAKSLDATLMIRPSLQ